MITKFRNLETDQKIKVINNVIVGMVVVALFHFLSSQDWGENVVNASFDKLQHREAKLASTAAPDTPIRFIDITAKSYDAWDKPLLTPRRAVAGLIQHAWKNGAKVIVLDIQLTKPDCCDPEGDRLLRETIRTIATTTNAPYLIIPVTTVRRGTIQTTIVDDLINKQPLTGKKVYRGIPLLGASIRDQRVRYWELYRPGVTSDGRKQVLWGVPLLASVLYAEKPELLENAEKSLFQNGSAASRLTFSSVHYKLFPLDAPTIPDLYSQRIRFLLLPPTMEDLKSNLLKVRRTADLIIGKGLADEGLMGKIALIGNSYEESGDLHETPVGTMPGMYVIGNAIHTITTKTQPVPLGGAVVIILEIAAVCAMAFIMGQEIPFYLTLLLFLVVVPFLAIEVNWLLYRYLGLFFNFAAPLSAMGIYRTGSKLLNGFFKKKKPLKEESDQNGETEQK